MDPFLRVTYTRGVIIEAIFDRYLNSIRILHVDGLNYEDIENPVAAG